MMNTTEKLTWYQQQKSDYISDTLPVVSQIPAFSLLIYDALIDKCVKYVSDNHLADVKKIKLIDTDAINQLVSQYLAELKLDDVLSRASMFFAVGIYADDSKE